MLKLSFLSVLFFYLGMVLIPAGAQTGSKDQFPRGMLKEERFVTINGIEQWITIKGQASKPAVLFLHGGPGSPLSPYADKLYRDLENDFVLVQWDQRGTGKTYGKAAPEELSPDYLKQNPLSIDLMSGNGIALCEYLLSYLGKQKIVLFGTSWGSALGVKMVSRRPDLFHAYIGHSQMVKPGIDTELYDKVLKMAEAGKDTEALGMLNGIGQPPYDRARKVGQLLRVVKKYERLNSTPAPAEWFEAAPGYDSQKDEHDRSEGDDYSFVNYAGDRVLGVKGMSETIDLMRDDLDLGVPVYLIQGEEDILTPKERSKAYFEAIKAPHKQYYLLPKTAHGFNAAVVETQHKVLRGLKIK